MILLTVFIWVWAIRPNIRRPTNVKQRRWRGGSKFHWTIRNDSDKQMAMVSVGEEPAWQSPAKLGRLLPLTQILVARDHGILNWHVRVTMFSLLDVAFILRARFCHTRAHGCFWSSLSIYETRELLIQSKRCRNFFAFFFIAFPSSRRNISCLMNYDSITFKFVKKRTNIKIIKIKKKKYKKIIKIKLFKTF